MGLFCQSNIDEISVDEYKTKDSWKWVISLGEDKINMTTKQFNKLKEIMCFDVEDENKLLHETITQLRNELALYKRKQGVGKNKELIVKIPFELVKDYIKFKED